MSLRQKTISGILWNMTERFSVYGIQFVVSVFLTRLLIPEDYGLIGMIVFFTAIAASLVDSGLNISLIRTKVLDEDDYSTVFLFNLVASIFIYIIFFFAAPFIADFYSQELLTKLVRVVSLSIIVNAFSTIQITRLKKHLNFRKQFIIQLPSTIMSGILGIIMAFFGYGVWSLAGYSVSQNIFKSAQLWIFSDWRPKFHFSLYKFKRHFSYGINIMAVGLLNSVFQNSYKLILGKFFPVSVLGFYTRASTMKDLPVANISTAVSTVTLPFFAEISDDNVALKRAYKRVMQQVMFWLTPVIIALIIIAEPLFLILFKEKWLPSVPYFQILAVSSIVYPLNVYNLNILAVKNRSDIILKLEIVKKFFIAANLLVGIFFGIYALLLGQVFLSVITYLINTFWSGKFIDYPVFEQLKDILKVIYPSFLMGILLIIIYCFIYIDSSLLRLLLLSSCGTIFFLTFSYLCKLEPLLSTKKEIFKRLLVQK